MTLFFWQNILSQLQAPYIISIKKSNPSFDITYIAEEDVNESRKKLGWLSLNDSLTQNGIKCLIAPNSNEIMDLFKKSQDLQTHHFFSGLTSYELVKDAFKISKGFPNVNRYLIAEGPFLYKIPKFLHYIKAYLFEKHNYKYIKYVFAIGKSSFNWYKLLGFDQNQVKPFCYVVQKPLNNTERKPLKGEIPTFTFVGNIIHRKGLDQAINAFGSIDRPFKFNIIGDGKDREELEALTTSLNLSESIEFLGVQKSNEIYDHLAYSDFLILPSRHDGWGAVVNEALMCGNYVIVSNTSGAQELIVDGFNGKIFDLKSLDSLVNALKESISNIESIRANSDKIKLWSDKIGAEEVGKYFVNCLFSSASSRITPPWKQDDH